jgi:hypothetical protein
VTGRGPVRKYVLRMPGFFLRFFLSSSNMATGCDLRSLDPFGVPLGVLMRNRKLHNTGSDRRSLDPFGSVHGVFSMTSASYNHRKPRILYLAWWLELNTRILYLAWLLELNTRVLYLAWWLELALVICTFYFHIGCVVLLRVHLKISTYKHAFFYIFTLLMFKIRQQLTKMKSINSMVDL